MSFGSELYSYWKGVVYMKLSGRIKPISYLKAHTAQIIDELGTQPGTVIITQNGEARAVVQDIESYEQTQESLALLKLLAQSQRSIEGGRHKPLKRAFADLGARTKNLP
jgi:prevent-host-death family protein